MAYRKTNYIIGTAGHIDHGKTSLIKALTGINTDRLKEEQERGITIDLGFAYFDGPDGRKYGIVDVPGHERFIPNMLAGAHGFDVVMMVVAADDGVKPQTIEHFEILHLLRIPRAMFVITKIDMVDEMRIEEVREEIEILISGSYLEKSKIIPASSQTGQGLDDVRNEISRLIGEGIESDERPYFRYPIDRSFTITGFGTVVTGTVTAGSVHLEDEVMLSPLNLRLRVRKIEVHDQEVDTASTGQRAAINLPRIEKHEILRGMELVDPQLTPQTFYRFYADIEMLPNKAGRMKNFSRARLFKGTFETIATLVNLTDDHFEPKGRYIIDAGLKESCLVTSGDRFILRDETNRETIGGGEFLIPSTLKRNRITPELREYLVTFASDDIGKKLKTSLMFDPLTALPVRVLMSRFNIEEEKVKGTVKSNASEFMLIDWRGESIALKSRLTNVKNLVKSTIEKFHKDHPDLPGIDKHALRDLLKGRFAQEDEIDKSWDLLIKDGTVVDAAEFLKLKDFTVKLAGEDAELKKKILEIYSDLSGNTPKKERLHEILKTDIEKINRVFQSLIKSKELLNLKAGVYLSTSSFENAASKAISFLEKNREISVAQFRDLVGTNRNMAVILLETMDSKGITLRQENVRILLKKNR
jgi:selenocysteine-specific elongation factor